VPAAGLHQFPCNGNARGATGRGMYSERRHFDAHTPHAQGGTERRGPGPCHVQADTLGFPVPRPQRARHDRHWVREGKALGAQPELHGSSTAGKGPGTERLPPGEKPESPAVGGRESSRIDPTGSHPARGIIHGGTKAAPNGPPTSASFGIRGNRRPKRRLEHTSRPRAGKERTLRRRRLRPSARGRAATVAIPGNNYRQALPKSDAEIAGPHINKQSSTAPAGNLRRAPARCTVGLTTAGRTVNAEPPGARPPARGSDGHTPQCPARPSPQAATGRRSRRQNPTGHISTTRADPTPPPCSTLSKRRNANTTAKPNRNVTRRPRRSSKRAAQRRRQRWEPAALALHPRAD